MLPKFIFNIILAFVVFILLAYAERQLKNFIGDKSFKNHSIEQDLLRFLKLIRIIGYLAFIGFAWAGYYLAVISESEFRNGFEFSDFLTALFWTGVILAVPLLIVLAITKLSASKPAFEKKHSNIKEPRSEDGKQINVFGSKQEEINIETKKNNEDSPLIKVPEREVELPINSDTVKIKKIETL